MDPAGFLQRALCEGRRYGTDPYVFLRELAQNARDAGSRHIEVTTGESATEQRVVFQDDGSGMSFEHARRYLLRLYASSKEQDDHAAGHFGVGFWSILQWEPQVIEIESRTTSDSWGLRLDAHLNGAERYELEEKGRGFTGTRVTLVRPTRHDDFGLQARVAQRLHDYARYLRHASKREQRIVLTSDGRRLDEPMSLPGPMALHFSSRGIEGVVGFAEEPRVELFSRGLLVSRMSFIEELDPDHDVPTRRHIPEGLAPVVLINSDKLEVVLSRQSPMGGRTLKRIVRLGPARLRHLLEHMIDRAAPFTLVPTGRGRAVQVGARVG